MMLINVQEYPLVLALHQGRCDIRRMATWLDFKELTAYLKMPRSTLYRLVQTRELPGHKIGRSWRFDQDEIDRWIKADVPKRVRRAKR